MSTKTLLSALLVSSFSMSLVSAATELKDLNTSTVVSAQTSIKFTANSKAAQEPILEINGQTSEGYPFKRPNENNVHKIAIIGSIVGFIDSWFYKDNKSLKIVSFEKSTINLEPFVGHTFLEGCNSIETVSFIGATGVDAQIFLEKYASTTLLQRILDRKCKLYIDMTDNGKTMAHFAKEGVYTQDAIHFAIRNAKVLDVIAKEKAEATSAVKPKGWLSTLTFGILGE